MEGTQDPEGQGLGSSIPPLSCWQGSAVLYGLVWIRIYSGLNPTGHEPQSEMQVVSIEPLCGYKFIVMAIYNL